MLTGVLPRRIDEALISVLASARRIEEALRARNASVAPLPHGGGP